MRIFLYEQVTAGGAARDDPLYAEAFAMFTAMRDDLGCLDGAEVLTLPADTGHSEAAFRQLAEEADYTLVIAPESGGDLERRCRWVHEVSGRLLGPDPDAVALTADKLATCRHLQRHAIATPPTWLVGPDLAVNALPWPCVLKPRDGAGSQATFLVRDKGEWANAPTSVSDSVVQPYVRGLPASIAFLIGPSQTVALPAARQVLSQDGRFHYEGGEIPLVPSLARRAEELGRQTVTAIPGLCGYVGVDLVLGDKPESDHVIEVNPRLTTSYIGLRALAETNLARAMVQVAQGKPAPTLLWRSGTIRFDASGGITADTPTAGA
jgi:tyramine---L-glutamate ligase